VRALRRSRSSRTIRWVPRHPVPADLAAVSVEPCVAVFRATSRLMYDTLAAWSLLCLIEALANYCLSLPRVALESRRLFYDVIRARFPDMARTPGYIRHASQSSTSFRKVRPSHCCSASATWRRRRSGICFPTDSAPAPSASSAPRPRCSPRTPLLAHGIRASSARPSWILDVSSSSRGDP